MKLSANKIDKHWSGVGKSYSDSWRTGSKKWMSRQELLFIENAAKDLVGGDSICLDVGSGNGRILDFMLEMGFSNINSCDIAHEMVSILKEKYKNNKKVKSINKINSINEIDGKYNLVTAIRVLKYNVDWKDNLKHLSALLNEGGVMVFTMPNHFSTSILSPYPIAKYKTNIKELRKIISELPVEVINIHSMFRLPDIIYSFDKVGIVPLIEGFIDKIFPKTFLGKIFFVALKKK